MIAGAGKTKLVSRVIDSLMNRPHTEALAFFYCNRNQTSRQEPQNILRSFVKQLSISPDEEKIQDCLVRVYRQKERDGFLSNEMSFEECETLISELIKTYSQTTLVLDALDECSPRLRGELIATFERLVENAPANLKIFISSRRDDDIKYQLEKKANVGISATDNEKDISKYVADRIEINKAKRRVPIPLDLQDEIIRVLLQKSGGM